MKHITSILLVLIFGVLFVWGWDWNHRTYPVSYGVSFSADYASWLGLDWKATYIAMLTELKPTYIRISAPWDTVEPTEGQYNFDDVDWQMRVAEENGARVTLVIGQKSPRWPECHVPAWIDSKTPEQEKQALLAYVKKAVERYRDNKALEYWQVENEPFIQFSFGTCQNYHKEFITDEITLTRSLDSAHKIVVTDSGELGTWYSASHAGDYFGTTLYRVVRSGSAQNIVSYDFIPPVFYTLKAVVLTRGLQNSMISELQAEPWYAGNTPLTATVAEQEQTMSTTQLAKNIDYARHIGVSRAYLWGVEWWYFMREKNHDARYWDTVKAVTNVSK